jgi:hypothetical protein
MRETMMPGTVLIKEGARLPEGMQLESEACVPGWRFVKNLDGYGFDRAIRKLGWNFFCLAQDMKVSAIGSRASSRVNRGIRRFATRVSAEGFNALEITKVSAKSFLGVPYVSMSARSRHVQQSMLLVRDNETPASGTTKPGSQLKPGTALLDVKVAVG